MKYESFENHYECFGKEVPNDEECVFTEKVDGANVQVYVGRNGLLKIARRGDFLAGGEDFHGIRDIVERSRAKFEGVYRYLESVMVPEPDMVSVCGEVFGGGAYPGHLANEPCVTDSVRYGPRRGFYAFDIRLMSDSGVFYLPWELFCEVIDRVGLFRAEALHTMKAGDVVKSLVEHNCIPSISPMFETTLPIRLGYKPTGDLAEGYVIRPRRSRFSANGTRLMLEYAATEVDIEPVAKRAKFIQQDDLVN